MRIDVLEGSESFWYFDLSSGCSEAELIIFFFIMKGGREGSAEGKWEAAHQT